MPRTIAVRVGYVAPPALQGAPADALGMLDVTAGVIDAARSLGEALGLTDLVTSDLSSGAVFGSNFGGNF